MVGVGSAAGVAVIRVGPGLRAPVVRDLERRVSALLRDGVRHILLDLADVAHLDAARLGELAHAYRLTLDANGVLGVAHASDRLRVLLARTGLLALLDADRACWPDDRPRLLCGPAFGSDARGAP